MTESSFLCNGYSENGLSSRGTLNADSTSDSKCTFNQTDTMTIGSTPFTDFDHIYASGYEKKTTAKMDNSNSFETAKSFLNLAHLDHIEEQAKEIKALHRRLYEANKDKDALLNRDFKKFQAKVKALENNECKLKAQLQKAVEERNYFENLLKNHNIIDASSVCNDLAIVNSIDEGASLKSCVAEPKPETPEKVVNSAVTTRTRPPNTRIRRYDMCMDFEHRSKNFTQSAERRNYVDETLKKEDAILFVNSHPPNASLKEDHFPVATIVKKKRIKLSAVTTVKDYYPTVYKRVYDLDGPATFTPGALEIPNFDEVKEPENTELELPVGVSFDVMKTNLLEQHSRFQQEERKRKKWDAQRIRELRQNERLKSRTRKNKFESRASSTPNATDPLTGSKISLLPDIIRDVDKILGLEESMVTSFGFTCQKIPSWKKEFSSEWMPVEKLWEECSNEDDGRNKHPS